MNCKIVFALTAALTAATVLAEEDVTAKLPPVKAESTSFFTLPVCRGIEGKVEVQKPNTKAWVAAEEGRFYPLGSSFRTLKNSTLRLEFGKGSNVVLAESSSISTRAQKIGEPSRAVLLTGGVVEVTLPTTLKPGLFVVSCPGFVMKNPAGESRYEYTDMGDGFDATVRCITGSIAIEGRHFTIPLMRAADAFRIRSTHDNLETVLYGKSGDYIAKLDKGVVTRDTVMDDGTISAEASEEMLDWHLSVGTRVQINRAVPRVGSRMSVTMMTFDPAGAMKNNFAFAEGCAEVNTGELIAAPVSDDDDEAAKRAAAAVTDGDVDIEDEPVEDTESGTSSDSSDSSDSDDSSDDSDDSDDDDDEF